MRTAILYDVDKHTREFERNELPEKTIRKIPKIERVFLFTVQGDLKASPDCKALHAIKQDVIDGYPVYRCVS